MFKLASEHPTGSAHLHNSRRASQHCCTYRSCPISFQLNALNTMHQPESLQRCQLPNVPSSPSTAKGAHRRSGSSAQMLRPPQQLGARVQWHSLPPQRSSRSPAPPQLPCSCSLEVAGLPLQGQGGFTKDCFSPKAQSPPPGGTQENLFSLLST